MKIEISNGELLDKLTILEIKLHRISDPEKLTRIQEEHSLLKPLGDLLIPAVTDQYGELSRINLLLWEIEDAIRDFERNQQFGEPFVEAARLVYRYNDERARVKREINLLTNSLLAEEKSYAGY